MNKLNQHMAKRFSGSEETGVKILEKCDEVLRLLQEVIDIYCTLEKTDGHIRNVKGLLGAAGEVRWFGVHPIEAKFPNLKSEK